MFGDIVQIVAPGIAVMNEVVCYFYQINPINSMFSDDTQSIQNSDLFLNKISKINMPGQILIQPVEINGKTILDRHQELFDTYGNKAFESTAISLMEGVKDKLKKQKYKHSIHLMFTQNREDFTESWFKGVFSKNTAKVDTTSKELMVMTYEKIESILKDGLSLREVDIYQLLRYIQIPTERKWETFYYGTKADYVEYEFQSDSAIRDEVGKKLYSRMIAVDKMPLSLNKTTGIFNKLQLLGYPVDMIVKFDVMVTKDFAKKMKEQRHQIERDQKRFMKAKGYQYDKYRKEAFVARIGLEGDNQAEDIKMKYQLMFRIYANNEKMLLNRYSHFLKEVGADKEGDDRFSMNYALGRQEQLMRNINPFLITFREYVHTTDVRYLANLNLFGGMYLGDDDGFVCTYTKPGDKPVMIDKFSIHMGKSKSTTTTTLVSGEPGSGKSQLVNLLMMYAMVFYGYITLCIDPKGDRRKLYDKLPNDVKSLLIIGDSKEQKGIFDPFNTEVDEEEALRKAKNLFVKMHRAVNPSVEVNIGNITRAFELSKKLVGDGEYERVTMKTISKELESFEPLWSSNMLEISKSKYGYLFFADPGDSKETDAFRNFSLDKQFNLIMFHNPPVFDSNANRNDIDHQLFEIILTQTEAFINKLMYEKEGMKQIIFDEYSIWEAIPNGAEIVYKTGKIARSFKTDIFVIDQYFSKLNNLIEIASNIYIGASKTKGEIENIIDQFSLNGNSIIQSVLEDRTKLEGVEEDLLYRFIYIDANNRKGVVKANFPDDFTEVLRTKLSKEDLTRYDN